MADLLGALRVAQSVHDVLRDAVENVFRNVPEPDPNSQGLENALMKNINLTADRFARQLEGLLLATAKPGCGKSNFAGFFAKFEALSHRRLHMGHHGGVRLYSRKVSSDPPMFNEPPNWHRRRMIEVPNDDHIPESNMDSSTPFHMVRHRARFRALWPLIPS